MTSLVFIQSFLAHLRPDFQACFLMFMQCQSNQEDTEKHTGNVKVCICQRSSEVRWNLGQTLHLFGII